MGRLADLASGEVSKKGFWAVASRGMSQFDPKHHATAIKEMRQVGATKGEIAGAYTAQYAPPLTVGAGGLATVQAAANHHRKVSRRKAVTKAFANRDEHSSIGATIARRGPSGPGQRGTLHTRTGSGAGRTRGVGHKAKADEHSSPKVTRVQPRHPNGRWVSHENDLQVIHPSGKRVTGQPKTSALGIFHKESKHGRSNTRFGSTGSKGKRLT